ncbi:lysine exporter protein LysE/YggA [Galbibacter marinus]|uniref:Lysine exporter protein LysE/YggA n=1 Tax=Galbibacter marinus TaxID=555500 RepID=K2Q367_9FLAO|nr:LysE family translocator [Galbibacter marinus]EKF55261.1 lysine exporter protein LysE/YggA [Galbibacter marinus]
MNWETLYLFSLASALLALAPGPDNIFVMVQSMVHGVKSGLVTTFGLISGCLVHTSLVAFGVSSLIQQSEVALTVLKIVGAFYLLLLAYKVFKSEATISIDASSEDLQSFTALYFKGFMMNVLNPKVALFFLAFFPGFLFHQELSMVKQFFVLGLLFMVVSLIVFSALAFLSGRISSYLKGQKNAAKVLKWMQIVVFVGIAIFILL